MSRLGDLYISVYIIYVRIYMLALSRDLHSLWLAFRALDLILAMLRY